MLSQTISVTPLNPAIGAEISGIDLGQPLDEKGLGAIREALTAHGVIFFRDQDISVEAQMALGAEFGELIAHPNDPGLEGHPEVMIIHATSRRNA